MKNTTTTKVIFMSTNKAEISELYNYLKLKGFEIKLNDEKMSVTDTMMYTISTSNLKQNQLKGFAIQYASYNELNNILIVDQFGNAKSINTLAMQPDFVR